MHKFAAHKRKFTEAENSSRIGCPRCSSDSKSIVHTIWGCSCIKVVWDSDFEWVEGAQRPLNLSRMFFKKSAANRLWYLYLLLRLGQSGIKEINFVSKITYCPFTISSALQKITSANSRAWIDPVPIIAALSFADGYLLQQVLLR